EEAMNTNLWQPASVLDLLNSLDVFRDEMGRWTEGYRAPEVHGIFDRTLTPALDVVETADAFIVQADVPGVDRKDIDLTMTDTVLSIRGEKKEETDDKGRKFFRRETWSGGFRRTLNLPQTADPGKVSAELKDGVLTITVQKREEVKPRMISVSVS
ncbi:MAG TPA: Hsp20/alpha crystallin family protein, partial [Magnetospirillaceae bacterium]|nr:Hsp20/alpha crystallin family protein [Magnetospirillaceae bacterium]